MFFRSTTKINTSDGDGYGLTDSFTDSDEHTWNSMRNVWYVGTQKFGCGEDVTKIIGVTKVIWFYIKLFTGLNKI